MNFSAHTTYLLIACIIALLFAGTGAYYVLDLQNKRSQEKAPETYLADTSRNTPKSSPTPSPTSTPNPTPDTTPKSTKASKTTQVEEDLNEDESEEKIPEILLSDQIDETLTSSCFKTCEYSYECSGDLQCLSINGINKCVNPACKTNSSCNCNLNSDASKKSAGTTVATPVATPNPKSTEDNEEIVNRNNELMNESLGGINDTEETDPLIEDVPAEIYEADLPKAGSQEFTLAILAIGIAITAIGVVWNKSQV